LLPRTSEPSAPWWVTVTFLLYTILWDGGIMAACFYLVLHGHSGWWIVGGLMVAGCCYQPAKWRRLWMRDPTEDRADDE
jgi:hypothetical protein